LPSIRNHEEQSIIIIERAKKEVRGSGDQSGASCSSSSASVALHFPRRRHRRRQRQLVSIKGTVAFVAEIQVDFFRVVICSLEMDGE
jgi:hypothetical protein